MSAHACACVCVCECVCVCVCLCVSVCVSAEGALTLLAHAISLEDALQMGTLEIYRAAFIHAQ